MEDGDDELYEPLEQAFSEFCQVIDHKIIKDCNTSKSSGIEFLTMNNQKIPDLDNFKVELNGVILDPEIPAHQRIKYYQLCCNQNRFLHQNIRDDSVKFIRVMVRGTAAIADDIQAAYSEGDFNDGDFDSHDKILKAFQNMGMAVGFLRAQIRELHLLARMRDLQMSD